MYLSKRSALCPDRSKFVHLCLIVQPCLMLVSLCILFLTFTVTLDKFTHSHIVSCLWESLVEVDSSTVEAAMCETGHRLGWDLDTDQAMLFSCCCPFASWTPAGKGTLCCIAGTLCRLAHQAVRPKHMLCIAVFFFFFVCLCCTDFAAKDFRVTNLRCHHSNKGLL